MDFPGGGTVFGRIIRFEADLLAVVFRQDAETLARLDKVLEIIRGAERPKAA